MINEIYSKKIIVEYSAMGDFCISAKLDVSPMKSIAKIWNLFERKMDKEGKSIYLNKEVDNGTVRYYDFKNYLGQTKIMMARIVVNVTKTIHYEKEDVLDILKEDEVSCVR